ncbi:hypothetical protein Gbro_1604 [Gordonia bronchialis DSM 43247]|uniref:Uncharacterized protein n=1 Tax=Gordonia bronchialis (strain ATCC 25592 / DSM 43247 / BCRC 13721 / JCM 3198 / KCTC 3076 / NBRC 16047 / NCTC 10667) TaxID=526226 RepID=D0L7L4_GORB4|nr:hypothetical protein [Gordonia bronchialis]ACY20877.1 hypothetical protein Gbro_1604 [Gordonia bronchialis DSM 43247]MCC3323652.1 hypothetical protein [Gordonia bronchialis]QGS25389.1 hypothetical protein FOB84_15845 [Gordonia bronchialis]STQ63716.1 Uncharacterised protein [Gordonia bronchialis]
MTNGAPLALAETSPALLTLGISLYSAVILICIGVGINAARHGRRRLTIVMAVIVGVLTVVGVVLAILSSVH